MSAAPETTEGEWEVVRAINDTKRPLAELERIRCAPELFAELYLHATRWAVLCGRTPPEQKDMTFMGLPVVPDANVKRIAIDSKRSRK